jgi:mannan endo-1,4-beta-mannosidase
MVTIGDEGFGPDSAGDGSYPYQAAAGGYVWADTLNITTIDFGTFHLYPDSWGQPYDWGNLWVKTHAARCVDANKPCLFEECEFQSHPLHYSHPSMEPEANQTRRRKQQLHR